MAKNGSWSMDELVDLAAAALAVGYTGPPTARARDLPDVRAVRWYVTTGLVDRPLVRGRFARYGRRHLLQLVAIKRRQAEGRTLAEIQAELSGAPDSVLEAVAGLPEDVRPASEPSAGEPAAGRRRFWTERPAAAASPAPPAPPAPEGRPPEPAGLVLSLRLTAGVTLLVDAALGPLDPAEVRRAAGPLLDLIDPGAGPHGTGSADHRAEGEDQP